MYNKETRLFIDVILASNILVYNPHKQAIQF